MKSRVLCILCISMLLSSCMFFLYPDPQTQPSLVVLLPGSNSRAAASSASATSHAVDYYQITLSNGTESLGPFTYENGTTASFDQLTAGTWKVSVEAWFANVLCGAGTAEAMVTPDTTAECVITLQTVSVTRPEFEGLAMYADQVFDTEYDSIDLIAFSADAVSFESDIRIRLSEVITQNTGTTLQLSPDTDKGDDKTFIIKGADNIIGSIIAVSDYGLLLQDTSDTYYMLLTQKGKAAFQMSEDLFTITKVSIKPDGYTSAEVQDCANLVMA